MAEEAFWEDNAVVAAHTVSLAQGGEEVAAAVWAVAVGLSSVVADFVLY